MTDTRVIKGVKAMDVVNYFDRYVTLVGAQFIDFDAVELTVYEQPDQTQEDIDIIMDWAEDKIFAAHLKN